MIAPSPTDIALTDGQYRQVRDFLYQASGITLGPDKKALVMGRLGKRLRARQCASYAEYLQLLSKEDGERQCAIDLLTTNETYFFREPKHFAFLAEVAIPQWAALPQLRIWSAASSSGEEAYSIAMVLAERRALPWQILASDLSTEVLETGRRGIYPMARAEKIPPTYLRRYCRRGIGDQEGRFQIDIALRQAVQFRQINLNTPLPEIGGFQMIMLRNVLIYFDIKEKVDILRRLSTRLNPGGYLIVGHSESLNGLVNGLEMVQASVYRKQSAAG